MNDLRRIIGLAQGKARYLADGCYICRGKHETTVRFSRIAGQVRGICDDCHQRQPRKKIIKTLNFHLTAGEDQL